MEKMIDNLTTKEKIIEAALEIIKNEGLQKVTVRKIAAMAGVNIAAINYHFGSKEKVLNEALEHVMIQMKKVFNYMKDEENSPEVRLETFIQKYSKNLFKYPDSIKNLIHQSIHENSVSNNFQEYLKSEGIALIKNTIHQLRPDENDSILHMLTMQLLSSLAFPVLLGNRAAEIFGIELNQTYNQSMYTKLLINNILRR